MSHLQISTIENRSRAATSWNGEVFDHQPRVADVAMSMVPASLILAAAAALLVALL